MVWISVCVVVGSSCKQICNYLCVYIIALLVLHCLSRPFFFSFSNQTALTFVVFIAFVSKTCFFPSLFYVFPTEAEAEEPAPETDHGPTPQPHLGDQLHAGCQELSHTHTNTRVQGAIRKFRDGIYKIFKSKVVFTTGCISSTASK